MKARALHGRPRRECFGLRADPAWVEEVAGLAQSRNDSGIPLLPGEVASIGEAIRASDSAVAALKRYGERMPDVYAGVILEGAKSILLVKGEPNEHARLLGLVLPAGSFEVRSVKWSTAELDDFSADVQADAAWFETIRAELVQAHPSTANLVRVRYRSATCRE